MQLSNYGNDSLIISFEDNIDKKTTQKIVSIYRHFKQNPHEAIFCIIPSYSSILFRYDILKYNYEEFCEFIASELRAIDFTIEQKLKQIVIPAWYDSDVGFDLERLQRQKDLTLNEIIELHSKTLYDVYAIGFAVGFAYMGVVDSLLQQPRLNNPRLKVPKGSVAIAEAQSAIYPIDTPGGWNIIAKTPLELVDFSLEKFSLFELGDSVRFEPISKEQFFRLGGSR